MADPGEQMLAHHGTSVMNTYGPPQRVLVRGEGVHVVDSDGKRYVDLLGGIAVNTLGHAHPRLVDAVADQLATLGHVSNFFATEPQVRLAQRLLQLTTARSDRPVGGSVFFANSGAEANEAAFKIARVTGRPRVIAAHGGFHGRTMGALALTGKPAISEPFEPLPGGVDHVPYGDVEALTAAVGGDVAAVVLEPIQGEGGVVPAPAGYLRAARDITSRHGALLVLDEVQTGVWRTGHFAAFQHDDALGSAVPDVVTLAKGLGGGIPVGACVALGDAAELLGPGSHGSTFGGNPVAAAAALTVLAVVSESDLPARVDEMSARLVDGIAALGHPLVTGVRGRGLLLGIALARPVAKPVVGAALRAGFIVNAVREDTVRLAPPLIIDAVEVDQFLAALPTILDEADRQTEPVEGVVA
jgi:acetylornithine/N-succinyldiaminopimelate aminotransferase